MSDIPQHHQWKHKVSLAFPEELSLRIWIAGIANAEGLSDLPRLFEDIAEHVLSLQGPSTSADAQPASKKRKLEDSDAVTTTIRAVPRSATKPLSPLFECSDVSVQAPLRKKLKVALLHDSAAKEEGQIRLSNPTTAEVEWGMEARDVEQAFCLPMPEKQARQANFLLFTKTGAVDIQGNLAEPVLFVMNETSPAAGTISGEAVKEDDTYVSITQRALDKWLSPHGKHVIAPDAAEFASSIPQSHRKGEKAYHVKAHRGSKEGYLFFLENGVVFGFKKPLTFFPFSNIDSISYTSVLQRTFNLVIAAADSASAEVKEVEFSMLDQEDFAGIDAYVKRHGLNDASMAAQRRAKAYNVNKEKRAETNGDVENGAVEEEEVDGQTELQKAEQQLQDEEDELEEDYEVSGGESEGEGGSSEEEEEEYADEEVEEEYEEEEAEE